MSLNLRGTRFKLEREELSGLPDSVLICLFPNGLSFDNSTSAGGGFTMDMYNDNGADAPNNEIYVDVMT